MEPGGPGGGGHWRPQFLASSYGKPSLLNYIQLQVNLCQKLLFLHQLAHNMTTDCSLKYEFSKVLIL